MAGKVVRTGKVGDFNPQLVKKIVSTAGTLARRYFRYEVSGLERIPAGAALVVSNHSGGMFAPDVLLFAPELYERCGYDRPIYTLAHDLLFLGPIGDLLRGAGLIGASRENARAALDAGALVVVFPGGDYDSYRPSWAGNVIDFNGRTGYVRAAIEAGVPIVPLVSIGGQETQLFLSRGQTLARKIGLNRARTEILPLSVGFPFGLSLLFPPNVPLPAKIVAAVLDPIDIAAEFGENPDVDVVDARVRTIMQTRLDELARKRRLPLLG